PCILVAPPLHVVASRTLGSVPDDGHGGDRHGLLDHGAADSPDVLGRRLHARRNGGDRALTDDRAIVDRLMLALDVLAGGDGVFQRAGLADADDPVALGCQGLRLPRPYTLADGRVIELRRHGDRVAVHGCYGSRLRVAAGQNAGQLVADLDTLDLIDGDG